MNETIESIENKIETVQNHLKNAPKYNEIAAKYNHEIAYLEEVDRKREELAAAMEPLWQGGNVIISASLPRQALATLQSYIADHMSTARQAAQQAEAQMAALQRQGMSIADLTAAIQERKAQMVRLRGGILGIVGMNKPIGDPRPNVQHHLAFIVEEMAAARQPSQERLAIAARRHELATASRDLVAQWIKENEVQQVGVRPVRYHDAQRGEYSAVILYRVILHDLPGRPHKQNPWPIDPATKCLTLPFEQHIVETWCHDAGASPEGTCLLAPWSVEIDPDGLHASVTHIMRGEADAGFD